MANLRVKIDWSDSEALNLTDLYPTVAVYNTPYKAGDCPIVSYQCTEFDEFVNSWICKSNDITYAAVSAYQAIVWDAEGTFDFIKGENYEVRVYGKSGGDIAV